MRVAQLWRYPVKSMQGESLPSVDLDESVPGDRVWGVRDSATGAVLTARTARPLLHAAARLDGDGVRITLPDGRELGDDDEHVDLALSAHVGTPVHLAMAEGDESAEFESADARWRSRPGTFNDGHPVHVLTTASLRSASATHPGRWDARRFRPNVLIDVDGDGFPEDGWRVISIGAVELEVYRRAVRCALTGRSQPGLDEDPEVPRSLARNRNARLGVYARVRVGGTVTSGGAVTAT